MTFTLLPLLFKVQVILAASKYYKFPKFAKFKSGTKGSR